MNCEVNFPNYLDQIKHFAHPRQLNKFRYKVFHFQHCDFNINFLLSALRLAKCLTEKRGSH